MLKSEFMNEASQRGFISQTTDSEALDIEFSKGMVTGYIGFDCTANSLHVGSLVQIMLLRLMQRLGHKPIALMGGATTKIGDPSLREEARQLLNDSQITANMLGIQKCFSPYINFGEGKTDALMPNNTEWLDELGYIDLLREVGVHFSVNRMLGFDSVKSRLDREQGLTFLEFNYSILQSYDFRELNRKHNAILQMGGSDQWGNIVSGIDLVRRTEAKQVFGLTTPLITTSSGNKMGKTANGAVWLTSDRLAPYDFWQFWRNTEDADVGKFLKLFTDIPLSEISKLEMLKGAEINEAKKILATAATSLAHGIDIAITAEHTAKQIFEQKSNEENLPGIDISSEIIEAGVSVVKLFVDCGLAESNGAAKRLIRGGGAKINDITIEDEALIVNASHSVAGSIKVSSGKKNHRLVKINR